MSLTAAQRHLPKIKLWVWVELKMQWLSHILDVAVWPIASVFTRPEEKQYWAYLVANAAIAAAVYLVRVRRRKLAGLWRFCLPRRIFLHPSALSDYKVMLVNNLFLLFITPSFVLFGRAIHAGTMSLLKLVSGMDGLHWQVGFGGIALATVIGILALDVSLFLAHYAQHKVPALWEFHKTHHSARVLTPFTVFRAHPVDYLLNITTAIILGSLTGAAVTFAFGVNPAITFWGVNAFEFAFLFLGYHLRHSHVWIMFPGWIGRNISSPALHQIHHSTNPRHHDKNMAQIFTFWDRLTGTLYLPIGLERLQPGIGHGEELEFVSLYDLYLRPFRMLSAGVKRAA
jgi:sterol desaturase/sphingolipid hydroxylase (fatty acid hydroxylase superfamily)